MWQVLRRLDPAVRIDGPWGRSLKKKKKKKSPAFETLGGLMATWQPARRDHNDSPFSGARMQNHLATHQMKGGKRRGLIEWESSVLISLAGTVGISSWVGWFNLAHTCGSEMSRFRRKRRRQRQLCSGRGAECNYQDLQTLPSCISCFTSWDSWKSMVHIRFIDSASPLTLFFSISSTRPDSAVTNDARRKNKKIKTTLDGHWENFTYTSK